MTDSELLEQHRQGAKDAFAQLVHRHIDWVYSAARRRVNDAHLAEDVTQAVFEVLARKMPRLKPSQTLSIWLFGVLNLTCKALLRKEARRHRHETEAAKMRSEIDNTELELWQEMAPQLEDIVGKLRHADRQAVLLRFYEQKSFTEVGQMLGISEEAARKRVSRAIGSLRVRMNVKDETISTSAIAGVLLAETTKSAPAALAGTVSKAGTASSLGKAVMTLMSWAQMKVAAILGISVIVVSGGTIAALLQLSQRVQTVGAGNPPPTTQIADSAARARDLLSRYEQSLVALTRIHYRYRDETRYERDYNFDAVPKFKRIESGEFFRDGERASTFSTLEHLNAPDQHQSATNLDRFIYNADNRPVGSELSFESWTGQPDSDWFLVVDTGPHFISQLSSGAMELSGCVSGEGTTLPLAKLLSDAPGLSVRSKTEQIDGHDTFVIDAQTRYGKHSIWIDPKAGYLARRIEVHKSGDDLEYSQPLNRPPPKLPPNARSIYPLVTAKAWDLVADHIQIDRIGDVFVPVSVSITDTRTFADGEVAIRHTESKREEIDLHPDFAAAHAFTMDMPDGTRVIYQDKQQPEDPRFEWRAGKVVQIERLYGRAMQDGVPIRIAWKAQLRPDDEEARSSGNWLAEDIRPDGLFSVSLTSSERELLMKNCAGQITIFNRSGTLGEVNISELSKDRDHPPQFTFPQK